MNFYHSIRPISAAERKARRSEWAAEMIAASLPTLWIGAIVTIALCFSSCGRKDDPEMLPNRMVPVDQTAEQSIAETGDGSGSSEASVARPSAAATAGGNVRAAPTAEAPTYALQEKGAFLGGLDKDVYLEYQDKWVGSKFPACNFFLITALCEAGYCKKAKPFYRAAQFDDYLFEHGWIPIDADTLKKMLREKTPADFVVQHDAIGDSSMGHVGVPVGLTEDEDVVVAQGNYGSETNALKTYSDDYLGIFTIFAKYDAPVPAPVAGGAETPAASVSPSPTPSE